MKIKISKLVEKFGLKPVNLKEKDLSKEVSVEGISSGVYQFFGYAKKSPKIIIMGKTDYEVFLKLSKQELEDGLKNLSKCDIPLIILSIDFNEKLVKENIKLDIPILKSDLHKEQLIGTIHPYIIKKLAKPERIHASLVNMYGEGVLIIGKSGIGKSELALDLINRKHLFIGDDAIEVISFGDSLYGTCANSVKNFLEVRGLGIVNVKRMFGSQVVIDETKINLVIELALLDGKENFDRLGEEIEHHTLQNIRVPYIKIPVSSGKNLASLVEAAVIVNKQRRTEKYKAIEELKKQLTEN